MAYGLFHRISPGFIAYYESKLIGISDELPDTVGVLGSELLKMKTGGPHLLLPCFVSLLPIYHPMSRSKHSKKFYISCSADDI